MNILNGEHSHSELWNDCIVTPTPPPEVTHYVKMNYAYLPAKKEPSSPLYHLSALVGQKAYNLQHHKKKLQCARVIK